MTLTSSFKTPEREAVYLEAYDATLRELWPVPYSEVEIQSRFGVTHVVISGPEDGPPLVLLHGYTFTLLMWAPYIADFTKDHRVYAIDVMGQPSKSVPAEPLRNAEEFVEWLTATLDALNVDRACIGGNSFGGWIALNFAVTAPDRVRKLVLVSPAASLYPMAKRFGLRAMLPGLIPTRRVMFSFMKWMGIEATDGDPTIGHLLDLMWLGVTHFRMPPETRRVMPRVFSDDELRSLHMPVLLLIGEHEAMYDTSKALARARQHIPNLEAELIPDSRHGMILSQHQLVNARTVEFLNRT